MSAPSGIIFDTWDDTVDYYLSSYAQRLKAILRATRLPNVIDLGRPLDIEKKKMTSEQIFQLARQLRAHHNVTELNLCGQRMDTKEMRVLLGPISLQRTMKSLNLSGAC